MSFFVPRVFGNEMEVFAADDECSMHLGRYHGASQYSTADGDLACEGAFLV